MPSFVVHGEGKSVRVVLVKRRPGGPWWFSYWKHNRKTFRSSGSTSEREARAAARDAVLSESGTVGEPTSLPTLIDGYLDCRWPQHYPHRRDPALKRRRRGQAYDRSYEDNRDKLYAFEAWTLRQRLKKPLLRLATREVTTLVQCYADQRRREVSGTSVRNEISVLRRFFRYLGQRGPAWDGNPAAFHRLELPAKEPVQHTDVTAAELAAYLKVMRGSEAWPVIVLCLAAGLRPVGASRLTFGALSLNEWPAVQVLEKRQVRRVALPAWAVTELQAWATAHPELQADTPLWPQGRKSVHDYLRAMRRQAGLPEHITLQAMRRVHSTMCYDAGMLPQDEARRLGHSVRVAEKSYVQWKQMRTSQGLERLNDALSNIAVNPEQNPEQNKPKDNTKSA